MLWKNLFSEKRHFFHIFSRAFCKIWRKKESCGTLSPNPTTPATQVMKRRTRAPDGWANPVGVRHKCTRHTKYLATVRSRIINTSFSDPAEFRKRRNLRVLLCSPPIGGLSKSEETRKRPSTHKHAKNKSMLTEKCTDGWPGCTSHL